MSGAALVAVFGLFLIVLFAALVVSDPFAIENVEYKDAEGQWVVPASAYEALHAHNKELEARANKLADVLAAAIQTLEDPDGDFVVDDPAEYERAKAALAAYRNNDRSEG